MSRPGGCRDGASRGGPSGSRRKREVALLEEGIECGSPSSAWDISCVNAKHGHRPRSLTSPGLVHDVWARIRRVSSLDSSQTPHHAFSSNGLPYDAITAGFLPPVLVSCVSVCHSHHEPCILETPEPGAGAAAVVCAKIFPCLSPAGIPSIPLQVLFYNYTHSTRSVRGKGQEAEPTGPRRAGATSPSAATPGQTTMASG